MSIKWKIFYPDTWPSWRWTGSTARAEQLFNNLAWKAIFPWPKCWSSMERIPNKALAMDFQPFIWLSFPDTRPWWHTFWAYDNLSNQPQSVIKNHLSSPISRLKRLFFKLKPSNNKIVVDYSTIFFSFAGKVSQCVRNSDWLCSLPFSHFPCPLLFLSHDPMGRWWSSGTGKQPNHCTQKFTFPTKTQTFLLQRNV